MLLETYSSQNSEQLREVLPNFLKIGTYVFAIYIKKMKTIRKRYLSAIIETPFTIAK